MTAQLVLVFGTRDGQKETRVFTQRPLGMQFRKKTPITISSISQGSQAEQFNVQLGWQLHSIGDTDVKGMTMQQTVRIFRESMAPLRECMVVCEPPLDAPSVTELSAKLNSFKDADVVPFLKHFGFNALTADSWDTDMKHPELRIGMIDGHRKYGSANHTWYAIVCKLAVSANGSPKQLWQVERRLAHIRAMLHDPVKAKLGITYSMYFESAPFAHRCGPRGTTARIEKWLSSLSKAINVKALTPSHVACILAFLEAPLPEAERPLPRSEPVNIVLNAEGIGQEEVVKEEEEQDELDEEEEDDEEEGDEEEEKSRTQDVPDVETTDDTRGSEQEESAEETARQKETLQI